MMRASTSLTLLWVGTTLGACAGAHGTPAGPNASVASVAAPVSPLSGSPPTPRPTDWKGLFDSDSQPYNVPPDAATNADLLRGEPDCARVDTLASGAFVSNGASERAALLTCGSTHRIVISDDHGKLATLNVTEDTFTPAGDMNFDGRAELLLIGHAGPRVSVRVLSPSNASLSSVYDFNTTLEPCAHVIIYYRLLTTGLDFRVDELPKRCSP